MRIFKIATLRHFLALIIGANLAQLSFLHAKELGQEIKKFDWDGTEIVWLAEDRFPTYNILIYFADGALSDDKSSRGITDAMFSMLTDGTRRYNQKQIHDNLEFYGVSYSGYVAHENSTFAVSGLVKDMVPTMKKICHLFADASFPQKELRKRKIMMKNSLNNLISNHSSLANRVFREVSLAGYPQHYPVGGKIKDFSNFSRKKLLKKLDYFNKKVKKRIYISGPKEVLDLKNVITHDCGWKGSDDNFVRNVSYKSSPESTSSSIYLVPVKSATQAQIRVGRFLKKGEFVDHDSLALMSAFLGGGFTSKLTREIRVKRGLTYSIYSYASGQKDYGRAGISTFTKNKTVVTLLNVLKGTLDKVAKGDFKKEELERARGHLGGSNTFKFELNSDYLSQLSYFDHVGRNYKDLYNFKNNIDKVPLKDVLKSVRTIFAWEKQTIVVVGNRSLFKELSKIGKVKIVSYKDFL